jgi:SAM-dependent methyltransferase
MIPLLILLVFVYSFAYASWRAAPWLPVHHDDVDRLCTLANIQPGQRVYELGCGDGRFICAAAQLGAQVVGFEISLLPFLLAHIRRLFQKSRNSISIRFNDFWSADLRDAELIYFWLTPRIHNKLRIKLENELRPGTKIICYVWPLEGWKPVRVDKQTGRPTMYLYQR